MTVWAHRFMVVPDAQKAVARKLVLQIAPPPSADGMWEVPLSPTGSLPATHWISTGLIQEQFAALMGNSAMTHGAYQQAGGTQVTLAQVQALYAASTIRADAQGREQECLDELGLRAVGGNE